MFELVICPDEITGLHWYKHRGYVPEVLVDVAFGQAEDYGAREPFTAQYSDDEAYEILRAIDEDRDAFLACLSPDYTANRNLPPLRARLLEFESFLREGFE